MREAITLAALSAMLLNAQPASRRVGMDQSIRSAVAGFQGTVSLFAKNLDSGETYGLRENERVRTASTIKLAVMAAVFEAVARGQAKFTDELVLHDAAKVEGSGVLREFSNDARVPIQDLVHLMIVVSDNTATNLLLDRFTADAVNTEMDLVGLKQTRCLRKIMQGTSASGWSRAGLLEENRRFGLGVSTPREIASLVEKMEQGEVVNRAASREMIAILKRQQDNSGISRRTGSMIVANKTGALDHLRSDVGIVYSPGGRIAIAITVDDLPKVDYTPDNAGCILISELTKLLVVGLSKTR
jgi:beta-lactamase class A